MLNEDASESLNIVVELIQMACISSNHKPTTITVPLLLACEAWLQDIASDGTKLKESDQEVDMFFYPY